MSRTSGTITGIGLAIIRRILVSLETGECAEGNISTTVPSVLSDCSGVEVDLSPSSASLAAASWEGRPTTLGSSTGGGGADTVRITAVPFQAGQCAVGEVRITMPSRLSGAGLWTSGPIFKPAALSRLSASSKRLPTTLGPSP